MRDDIMTADLPGVIRTLDRQEMPLLREHLLRLDPESRYNRFNGFADESFIAKYAEKCRADGTIIMAYLENGKVLAAAELHPADGPDNPLPERSRSASSGVRAAQGAGQHPVPPLIAKAKRNGYDSLRVTTSAQNEAMRALANKFGANLTFHYGESSGQIDLLRASPRRRRWRQRHGSIRPPTGSPAPRLLARVFRARVVDPGILGQGGAALQPRLLALGVGFYGRTPATPRVGR